jgi:putative DNA modification/repair radical SAM protein
MDIQEKLKILADSAKYDASCSSSGGSRKNSNLGLGNSHASGICHSWSDDGRCISLLKILYSNVCIYDCIYCVNRVSNDVPRAVFTTDEIINLTINFYRRNYIEGLFLSSAVHKSPDYTMEQMLEIVKKLRVDYKFNGYIHLKAIPGADKCLIYEAGKYADRMSVNIELPSEKSLSILAPQKKKEAIFQPMNLITSGISENINEKKYSSNVHSFVPAGQTTQLIVGASPEHDMNILKLSENLYKRFKLKRVYYSAYIPVVSHPNLPAINKPPLLREHRLYQADWLLRFYNFKADEILNERAPDFDVALDPKCNWAINNLNIFPVEINKADYNMLLRVPGIGVKSARNIMMARREKKLSFEDLKKTGAVIKRARYFITCQGKFYGVKSMNHDMIRLELADKPKINAEGYEYEQLSFFSLFDHFKIYDNVKNDIQEWF